MIILLKRFCVLLCVFLLIPFAAVAEDNSVSAASAISYDAYSGKIFYQKDIYTQRPIASTTKIMTCLLACESGKLKSNVTVTDEMLYGTEGTLIYLKTGDRISLFDLVKGAMLASGNDAANAIAVFLSGSVQNFVAEMNSRAKEIGMTSTHFVTPSGLDKGRHMSTAYDMALLAAEAVQNRRLMSIASMTAAEITVSGRAQTVYNHNKLLSVDKGFFGLKTGFTKKAGRCLVSAYRYGGSVIITVTLSAPNDWEDHKTLVSLAKKCYKSISKTQTFRINTVGSEKQNVSAQYSYTCKAVGDITVKEYYYPFVYAPVKAGQVLGKADIYIGKAFIKSVEIKATEGISKWQITK